MRALFRQFSFPGGIPSHVAPETPGSIHEGGELGYALVHAYGAAFDNPDLLVLGVVGDGEAETGPLAASWHSNKFLNPVTDGAVLPVLHLNGYKIANPTLLARIPEHELAELMRGYGYEPHFVGGSTSRDDRSHSRQLAATLDRCSTVSPRSSGRPAAEGTAVAPGLADDRAAHPEGLDRPEGGRRSPGRGHVPGPPGPVAATQANPEHRGQLEQWLRSYRPEELFDPTGRLVPELQALAPQGERRMSANPHANGGRLLHGPE